MTKVSGLTAVARAACAFFGSTLGNPETRDTRHRHGWKEDLAEMLDADLASLDGLMHGFAAAGHSSRSPASAR
jgi:hypothetical protein